jgi:hypothetical protein
MRLRQLGFLVGVWTSAFSPRKVKIIGALFAWDFLITGEHDERVPGKGFRRYKRLSARFPGKEDVWLIDDTPEKVPPEEMERFVSVPTWTGKEPSPDAAGEIGRAFAEVVRQWRALGGRPVTRPFSPGSGERANSPLECRWTEAQASATVRSFDLGNNANFIRYMLPPYSPAMRDLINKTPVGLPGTEDTPVSAGAWSTHPDTQSYTAVTLPALPDSAAGGRSASCSMDDVD